MLGETWWLPGGVALLVAGGLLAEAVAPEAWHDAGAFVLLAAVVALLVSGTKRGAGPPRPAPRDPSPEVLVRR